MKLLEYQAKQQFQQAGIAIPLGELSRTAEQAQALAKKFGHIAVKAQVPVGGRGKAGGIALVDDTEKAYIAAQRILAMRIGGYPVSAVLCEVALQITHEFYLGVTLDREQRKFVMIFSVAGGMEIEEVAEDVPDKIAKLWIDPFRGPQPYEIRQMLFAAFKYAPPDLPPTIKVVNVLVPLAQKLYNLAVKTDALICEINPLAITTEGNTVAADGKLEIDENAYYRQQQLISELTADISDNNGQTGEDQFEAEARRRGLTYVHLNGYVGCIGNGAGLVMNTLDLVKQQGGEPANFLDIGGGAKAEVVRNALELVLLDPAVRGVFINIFGGITRCDEVAKGIIQARDELKITKPLVVRMTGTQEEAGRSLLTTAGITPGINATDTARKIVELTKDNP